MKNCIYLLTICSCFACSPKQKKETKLQLPSLTWLDSVKEQSDTMYTRPYRNQDFVTADYFVNRKLHTVCQVMKDSKGTIRQIIAADGDKRSFFAEYYPNGQLMAKLPLDSLGKYNGPTIYYYQNGSVKSQGSFLHGLYSGEWNNYNEKGKLLSRDQYDVNGNLVKTVNL